MPAKILQQFYVSCVMLNDHETLCSMDEQASSRVSTENLHHPIHCISSCEIERLDPSLVVAPRIMPPKIMSSSAERPGNPAKLPLGELNKSSAKTSVSWAVVVHQPREDIYHYNWQGKERQGANFIVTLVSEDNAGHYCQAHFKKTAKNTKQYEQTKTQMQQGKRFLMSKVTFVEEAKTRYISCPLKVVVDLSSTKMDLCAETLNSDVHPVPQSTVAGGSSLDGNQFFDVIALVQQVHEIRPHPNNRSSFMMMIYDGSKDEASKKVMVIPLKIYFWVN